MADKINKKPNWQTSFREQLTGHLLQCVLVKFAARFQRRVSGGKARDKGLDIPDQSFVA